MIQQLRMSAIKNVRLFYSLDLNEFIQPLTKPLSFEPSTELPAFFSR